MFTPASPETAGAVAVIYHVAGTRRRCCNIASCHDAGEDYANLCLFVRAWGACCQYYVSMFTFLFVWRRHSFLYVLKLSVFVRTQVLPAPDVYQSAYFIYIHWDDLWLVKLQTKEKSWWASFYCILTQLGTSDILATAAPPYTGQQEVAQYKWWSPWGDKKLY